jgi:hypothetical protein
MLEKLIFLIRIKKTPEGRCSTPHNEEEENVESKVWRCSKL